ncbi:MAG: DNA modification methylase, partial [Sphingosinicella sp.]|uniref:DNA modification methylase n=1 Tax=Sphingosinicella sp. TaxID=1917971 RepID=UPI0040380499
IDPPIINSAKVIVDGHLRWEVARALGLEMVPVIMIEHLSDAELRAFAIATNKLPAVANYDVAALRLELEEIRAEIPKLDVRLLGYTPAEVDRLNGAYLAGLYDDLDDGEAGLDSAPPISARGNLYTLGDHRLICGDSLDPEVIARLMGTENARCCFTDPPYGVKIEGHVTSSGLHPEFAMGNGATSREELAAFLRAALANIATHLIDGGIAFVCMDHAHLGELLAAGEAAFDERLNLCVWDKGQGGMGSLYRSQHELVVVFKKGAAPHLNNVLLGKNGRDRTNIWSFPGMGGFGKSRRKARELHPTVKPVALVAEALLDVTAPGDVVLDAFGGSGSTLIAAERTGRRARLVEYEPRYVDRTIARWEKLTGRKAELIEALADNDAGAEDREGGGHE